MWTTYGLKEVMKRVYIHAIWKKVRISCDSIWQDLWHAFPLCQAHLSSGHISLFPPPPLTVDTWTSLPHRRKGCGWQKFALTHWSICSFRWIIVSKMSKNIHENLKWHAKFHKKHIFLCIVSKYKKKSSEKSFYQQILIFFYSRHKNRLFMKQHCEHKECQKLVSQIYVNLSWETNFFFWRKYL